MPSPPTAQTPRPATLRIELFPANLSASIHFYTQILGFVLTRHEPDPFRTNPDHEESLGYAHLHLPHTQISLGLSTKPPASYPSPLDTQPASARVPFRRWPVGVEIVLELPELSAVRELRDRVVGAGWELESELAEQEWGLWDFRVVDPDGYFWRVTEWGEDGKGARERKA